MAEAWVAYVVQGVVVAGMGLSAVIAAGIFVFGLLDTRLLRALRKKLFE